MKLFRIGIFLFFPLLLWHCQEDVTEPQTVQFNLTIQAIDSSEITSIITQNQSVPGAIIEISGITTGLQYSTRTNTAGIAVIENVIPDAYNLSAIKTYPADTMNAFLQLNKEQVLTGNIANQKLYSGNSHSNITLHPVTTSPFVISEIYYNGAPYPPPLYFHDQFTEIYNNSPDTMYLDDYAIGDLSYGYRDDPDFVYCIHLYEFPGDGESIMVPPGETIVIAQDADDHTIRNAQSLDLSNVDFEYYNAQANDIDNVNVPNMIQTHHKYGIDFLYSVFNDAIVLVKMDPDVTLEIGEFDLLKVPKSWVEDGVEYKEDQNEFDLKRLSDDIDSGIAGGLPSYQGKSIARKVFKIIDGRKQLSDQNNSSTDFLISDTRTPGWIE